MQPVSPTSMPPRTSHTLPVIYSHSSADPLPHSVTSPGLPHSEFSRTLEQSFAWTPPDLTMSSQSGPSIVALSSSEIVQLGLGRFLDDSVASHLGDAQKSANCFHAPPPSCFQLKERIQQLDRLNCELYANQSDTTARAFCRPELEGSQFRNIAYMPVACTHLLSAGPASPFSSSSVSRAFPAHSSRNSGEAICCSRISGPDYDHRPNRSSRLYASRSDNPSMIGATSHEPCSHSDVRTDDTPSALDFHINTFPSSVTGHNFYSSAVTQPENLDANHLQPDSLSLRVLSFCHPSESPSTSLLQSLGTPDTLSLSPTFPDRVDLDRRLIHFPSPTFSLSQFPSTLSSPVFASSPATDSTGDGAVLPSNCEATDIIINMTPISDDNISDLGSPESTQPRLPERRKAVTERVANLGGKLKRLFLKQIRSAKLHGDKAGDVQAQRCTEYHYEPNVDAEGDTTPVKPPGLPHDKRRRVFSNLAQRLSLHVHNTPPYASTAAVEIDNPASHHTLGTTEGTNPSEEVETPIKVQESKLMKKRFSLSLFSRSSVVNEGTQNKKSRPKSMSDLSEHHPEEKIVGEGSMLNVMPLPHASIDGSVKRKSKRSKRLSLQFLRERF